MTAGWRHWQQSYPICRVQHCHDTQTVSTSSKYIRQQTDFILSLPPNKSYIRKSASRPALCIFILIFVPLGFIVLPYG